MHCLRAQILCGTKHVTISDIPLNLLRLEVYCFVTTLHPDLLEGEDILRILQVMQRRLTGFHPLALSFLTSIHNKECCQIRNRSMGCASVYGASQSLRQPPPN